jgi:hypothetical protein
LTAASGTFPSIITMKGEQMIEDFAGADTDSGAARRPYIKPFVRNLDAVDTEGKNAHYLVETAFTPTSRLRVFPEGPS